MRLKQALYLGVAVAALAVFIPVAPNQAKAQQSAGRFGSTMTISAASSAARTGRKPASG